MLATITKATEFYHVVSKELSFKEITNYKKKEVVKFLGNMIAYRRKQGLENVTLTRQNKNNKCKTAE